MASQRRLLCAACCLSNLLGVVPPGEGRVLRIEVVPGASLKNDRLQAHLTIVNRGDEPAHAVQPEAALYGARGTADPRSILGPGDRMHSIIDLGRAPTVPGIHTIAVTVRYLDGNGYPFSTRDTLPLVTRMPPSTVAPIAARLTSATLDAATAALTLSATNRTDRDLRVHLRWLFPEETPVVAPATALTLPARAHVDTTVTVSNRWGRRGSRYAVFACLDTTEAKLAQSVVAEARLHIPARRSPLRTYRRMLWGLLAASLLAQLIWRRTPFRRGDAGRLPVPGGAVLRRWMPRLLLAGLTAVILMHLYPAGLLSDTMAVGGDTPAHNYLASQLKQQIRESGRLIGWSPHWWCGFPLFQYYFILPYAVIALLSVLIPFNIAFKLVSVAGILLLPAAACLAGRRLRLPDPAPLLLAIAMVVLLFDPTHTMWGVNIYSTLAGMMANSWSFAIMLLFIGCAARDADDGQFRLRSVLLFAALLASHFFTSVMAVCTLAAVPLLRPAAGPRRAALVLAGECALGALLMAWWLTPLIAKRGTGVDFGVNWTLDSANLPRPFFRAAVLPLAAFALLMCRPPARGGSAVPAAPLSSVWRSALRRESSVPLCRFVWMTACMLAAALFLFRYGYPLSPVFVNVRLWPFITYAALALAAAGAAILVRRLGHGGPAVLAIAAATLLWGVGDPETVMQWSEWNYEGLQRKARWPVFRDLILPLAGTPGRLANDLHDHNVSFGSSRIFEATPHLTGKPILEGGIVNSAVGALFAYYIQSETSDRAAGHPPIVQPATFDIERATRHLALFNVKHFMARSQRTQEALNASADWSLLKTSQGWSLYELLTHDGAYVFVPERDPVPLRTRHWKQAGLDWMYDRDESRPFQVLLDPEQPAPPTNRVPRSADPVTQETVHARRIRFTTRAVGAPHIVKCTYFPNWKVRGAARVYRVTPSFLLVYPTQHEVELYYGYTVSDTLGHAMTIVGLLGVLGLAARRRGRRRHKR